MDKKLTYVREPEYRLGRRILKDMLIIKNKTDKLMLVQIRVNGYLLDFASVEGLGTRYYSLKNLPLEVDLTVADVEEDVDLTLPENKTYRQFEFFEQLT